MGGVKFCYYICVKSTMFSGKTIVDYMCRAYIEFNKNNRNMNKFYLCIMSVVLGFLMAGCSKEEENLIIPEENGVDIEFLVDVNMLGSQTRANSQDLMAEKFVIVAYAKEGELYKFYKALKPELNELSMVEDEYVLSNKDFNLEVGAYRFLALYFNTDIEDVVTFEYYGESADENELKEWNSVLASGKIVRNVNNQDLNVGEIFAFSSDVDVNLSAEKGKVQVPIELNRVNSRIDLLVKKVYRNDDGTEEEVGYSTSDVLGGATDINSIETKVATCVSGWGFDKQSVVDIDKEYSFLDNDNSSIIVGVSENPTVDLVNGVENDKHIINSVSSDKLMKGSCYYKGAYILPFVATDASVSSSGMDVTVLFKQATTDLDRNIFVQNVKARENCVSLITMKLITKKDPDVDGGDDEENIFNPNVQFSVTINTVWAGVDNTDIDI